MPVKSLIDFSLSRQFSVFHEVYTRLRGLVGLAFLRGSSCTCLICGHSFRKFLPVGYRHDVLRDKKIIGGGYRERAICPYCRSIDRERLVYFFLNSRKLLHPGIRVLHIAPERNIQRLIKRMGTEYISADLNSPLADLKMDIQDIPFPDAHFDAIICNHVLEHVTDDLQAMKEFHRVLKPGGWAILQVPFSSVMEKTLEDPTITDPKQRELVFGQANHARMYGLDYPDRLHSTGFTVQAEQADMDSAGKYLLNPDEPVFFCRK